MSAPDHSNSANNTRSESRNASQQISLVNFNPSSKDKMFINSPRSREALRRCGFEDHELLIVSKEEFLSQPVPAEFADDKDYYCEIKAEHYEKRRKEKLKMAIQERDKIIKDDIKKTGNTTNTSQFGHEDKTNESGFQSHYGGNFVDKELKKIQQMKNQQKKEIEFIIQNDLRVQEMVKKNEEKLRRMEEMEERRRLEVEQKQKEAEYMKKKRELQKQEREKELEEQNRIIAERQKLEEHRRREVQEKLAQDRQHEAIMKEKQRQEKALMRELKIEEMEELKREYLEKQKEEREHKLVKIKEQSEEKQKIKQRQSELARKNFEFKIKVVRQKYDDEKEEQRRKVIERQSYTNSKREKFEEEKKNQLDMRRNRSEAKVQEIKKILDEKFQQDQAKKIAYLDKYRKAEENKKVRDEEMEQQRLLKIQRENEKEYRLKQVLTEYQLQSQTHNDFFLKTLNHEQMRAERQKEELLKGLKRKYIIDMLRMEDAEENNRRLEKLREDKRTYLTEKITISTQKVQQLQADREKAFQEKKKLQNKLEAEKAEVLKEFEKKKKQLMKEKASASDESPEIKQDSKAVTATGFKPSSHNAKNTSMEVKPGENSFHQQAIYKPTIHSAKLSTKAVPNQEKIVVKSVKNVSMNKTGDEHNLLLVDPPSKSFISNRSSKGNLSSEFRVHTKKEDGKLPKNLRESPYVRSTQKVPTGLSKDSKALFKVINAAAAHKEDTIITDLQTQQYKKAAEDVRKDQLGELLEMIGHAVSDDKDEQKVEGYLGKLLESTKKQQEEITNVRQQNNFLLFA